MSRPFTRAEAKTAVWAQVEDLTKEDQITALAEVLADMKRQYRPLQVKLEQLSRDFADKAMITSGLQCDAWRAAAKACWELARE